MLTLERFQHLLTNEGQTALAEVAALDLRPEQRLRTIATLRKHFPPDLATDALEQAVLRQRARAKFRRGHELYWTREALEQSSGEAVAHYRTQRFVDWEAALDLCCSVGGDLLELAQAGLAVTGVDLDPVRLALAAANAEVYGVSERVTLRQADVATLEPPFAPVIFFDPARRAGERRVFHPDHYSPPLGTLERWLPHVAGLAVKTAPGIDYDNLPWPCEVEIISLHGEVKEAVLWFGALRRGDRTATLLPSAATIGFEQVAPVPITPPDQFFYEPDGAVIRAHLVEQLAHLLDATKIDPDIAFLTAPHLRDTPFARAFRVEETLPFNLKQLRARLRERGVGRVVVKKRGSPIDPQELEKQLRLVGEHELTVILTQAQGKPVAVLCQPVS